MLTKKETFKRVRFIACEGDADMLVGRTGLIISGGEGKYSQSGFDCIVLLDEHAHDHHLRQYCGAFADYWFPEMKRWPLDKYATRILMEADSAIHLEVIGSEEVDLGSGFIRASSIEVRAGAEGPKHDRYGYEEWTLTRGSDTWLIHLGLGDWVKRNDVLCLSPAGCDLDDVLKAAGCPLSLREIEKYHARIKAAPLKTHKAHGGMRWADGMPGETLLFCKCGAVLDGHSDINAII
jgi:hypothetical protein